MKHDDIKIGEYYVLDDGLSVNEIGRAGGVLIFIIGRDPFSGKLVATCDEWGHKVDLLEDNDYEFMERI